MYCPSKTCPDAERTGGPGEYRAGIRVCPRCGSDLVQRIPTWAEPTQDTPDPSPVPDGFEAFLPVYTITNRGLIPFVHSLLAAAEVRYFIRDERTLHKLIALEGAVVLVEPSRAEEAREMLLDLEAPEP